MSKPRILKLSPMEVSERLYVRVAKRIAELVQRGGVQPGEKLPSERDLAEMLQVSRPTIREAMIALEVSGLIEVRTGSGIYVNDRRDRALDLVQDSGVGRFDIFELRLMIEPEAAALAAQRMSDAQIIALREIVNEMAALAKTAESEAVDQKFHIHIAPGTENAAIIGAIEWLWQLRRQSKLSAGFHRTILNEGVYPVIAQHGAVVDAIAARDATAAREAMRNHLESATDAAATHFGSSS